MALGVALRAWRMRKSNTDHHRICRAVEESSEEAKVEAGREAFRGRSLFNSTTNRRPAIPPRSSGRVDGPTESPRMSKCAVRFRDLNMRRYKDMSMQLMYEVMLQSYKQRAADLFMRDGSRRTGASHKNAFWAGFDGVKMRGNRVPYVRGSANWAAYFAGVDARRLTAN